ncbi:MAG TPA: hypothetical protein VKD47_07925 [Miltoncostaeaceae bacterium]|nr:hypothetical protein [Miltoncostaeaceae bacterium]
MRGGRRPTRSATALVLGAACLAAIAPAARADELRTLDGWPSVAAALSGDNLVYLRSAAAPAKGYTVYRTEAWRLPIQPALSLFTGVRETPITIRTSAGRTTAGMLSGGAGGAFTLAATGKGFAPPVIWCCDPKGDEVVLESDSRPDAPQTIAVGTDGAATRFLVGDAEAGFELTSVNVVGPTPTQAADYVTTKFAFPGKPVRGLAAIGTGLVAWADRPGPPQVSVGAPGPTGLSGVQALAQPGRVLGVWAGGTTFVALAKAPDGLELARYDLPSLQRTVIWTFRKPPPAVAVGGGAVTFVDGRNVIFTAPGRAPKGLMRAKGPVVALATDGQRVAVFDRRVVNRRQKTAISLLPVPAA